MAFSSSRQKLIGPVESDYIMNHYKAFTYANPINAQQQETKVDIDLSAQPKPSNCTSDVKSTNKKRTGTTSLHDKKFVPTFHNGDLYFIEQDKEQNSSFKGTAKPAPSVTSLNRELSTVSYDYDQLNAILGPYTMRRLIAHSKTTSELKQNAGVPAKELSQDALNMLRTALETLSHVDAATLRRQYKEVGPMAIQGLDCIPVQPAPAPDQQSDHGEIGNTAATAPPDELALPTDKSDALECEHAKEIQGAAELCIRPSKVAVMKSETELNMKYNAMVTEVVAQRMSKESGGSRESSNPNAGQIRSAAGKAHSAENVSDEASADTEGSSTGDIQSLSCSYSYESSSLTTADDPSMLYPTAASCSYSDDISGSELDYGSLHTASDGWWTENMESSHCVSSVSTGIWLSNCSEPPSSLYSAQSLSSADLVTADLYTGDMETAEAAESDIEAANLVFDMILTAKSESVYPCYTDEINTADSSLVQGDAEVEQHPEAKISHAALCPLDEVQNTTSEDCITGEEHSESLSSASSTSCCHDRYYSLESDGVEVREIESQTNMGSTRG